MQLGKTPSGQIERPSAIILHRIKKPSLLVVFTTRWVHCKGPIGSTWLTETADWRNQANTLG